MLIRKLIFKERHASITPNQKLLVVLVLTWLVVRHCASHRLPLSSFIGYPCHIYASTTRDNTHVHVVNNERIRRSAPRAPKNLLVLMMADIAQQLTWINW